MYCVWRVVKTPTIISNNPVYKTAGPSGRAVLGVGLWPFAFLDCGFESRRGHKCCLFWVACCLVQVSRTGRSLIQRSTVQWMWSRSLARGRHDTESGRNATGKYLCMNIYIYIYKTTSKMRTEKWSTRSIYLFEYFVSLRPVKLSAPCSWFERTHCHEQDCLSTLIMPDQKQRSTLFLQNTNHFNFDFTDYYNYLQIKWLSDLPRLLRRGKKKVKIKVTLVQALRLCTGRTAHRGSRGIALLFLDHCTRRGWGVSVTPRPLFTPGKDPVPIVQEAW